MIKVEHKHGKITHSHFGGDTKHNHEVKESEPVESLEHWHTDKKRVEKVCHAHKGGNVLHEHPPGDNLVDYWKE